MIRPVKPVLPAETGGDVVRATYMTTLRIGEAVNELIQRSNNGEFGFASVEFDPNIGDPKSPADVLRARRNNGGDTLYGKEG